MTKFHIAAAVAATLVTPSAFAAPAQTADTVAAAAQTTLVQPGTPPAAKRYCIVETPTGSRIPQKKCQTRADWLNDGVDVLTGR